MNIPVNHNLYFGNYLGIVIQNNDPQKRGRVKVFVPHISPTVYKGWNDVKKDKKFKFVGANTYSDLTDILEDLKKILPWSECAAPLAGESSSGRYNIYKNVGSISDTNRLDSFVSNISSCEIDYSKFTKHGQNYDLIGEKPANMYDYYPVNDAFTSPELNNVNNVNKFSYNYKPEAYSNSAHGSFSVPNVGSHLWIFFANGNPLKPVYFATSFGYEDWRSIYSTGSATDTNDDVYNVDNGIDYPGEFENKKLQSASLSSINTETYRNKFVINQKGGTLSFVNTDNRETVKLSHFSGSFKEFNNFVNIEFASKNDQKLVMEDSFYTVYGNRNEFVKRDVDNVIQGNVYKKIGNLNKDLAQQWKKIVDELADIKQQFDIQRAEKISNKLIKFTSTKQNKSGTPTSCPVCRKADNQYFAYNISYKSGFTNPIEPSLTDSTGNYPFAKTITGKGIKQSIKYPGVCGSPKLYAPYNANTGAVDGSINPPIPGKIFGVTCPGCGGKIVSPASKGGNWKDANKQKQIQDFLKQNIKKLSDIEEQLGIGGSEIIEITKHKIETIGTVMNDFGSIRIDSKGKMSISDVQVGKFGSFYNRTPSPVIEYVNVDDLPGGNYTLNVCNRYNLTVGAGGVNVKTVGPVNISGTITNVAGAQVNIGSQNEVNIDGGKRLSLVADIISIRQRNANQTVIEGTLGVTKNAIFVGGVYVEGELLVNHITAPAEWQETEKANVFCAPVTDVGNINGKLIGFGVPMSNFPIRASSDIGDAVEYKEAPPLDFGAPYMGFTDTTKVVGRIEREKIIGYIKVGTELSQHCCPGSTPGDIKAQFNIPVYCSYQTAASNIDVPIWGSGPGPGNNLPSPERQSIKGTDIGTGGNIADKMCIAVYGTGRDEDCISIPDHSHMFKNIPLTLVNTNSKVREAAQKMNSGGIVPSSPIVNSKK